MQTLKKEGDWLEKVSAEFVLDKIPAYEQIWQIFIGHDQKGNKLDLDGANATTKEIQTKFAQSHYTILESLYFMKDLVREASLIKEVNSFADYQKAINIYVLFHSYSGRIKDNMFKCFECLAGKSQEDTLKNEFESFWHQRCIVLHGKKVPIVINSTTAIQFARLKRTTSDSGFGLESSWSNVTAEDFQDLAVHLDETFTELSKLTSNQLNRLFGCVKKFLKENNLKLLELKDSTLISNVVFKQDSNLSFVSASAVNVSSASNSEPPR